jgi:Transposase DNA-binding/Transposase Tn5 dimerisation domain
MNDTHQHSWAEDELRYVDLGDRRLNRRLARLVGDLAARPTAPVPQACASWAATKAAYRFWDQDRVCGHDIIAAHSRRTRDRLPADGQPVLAIQDTTLLNFSHHPATSGLGYLSDLAQRGLLVHSTLCVGPDGVPLGLLGQHVWARDDAQFGKRRDRKHKPTKDKESQRWLDGLAGTEDALPPQQGVVTVADREADFYDLFAAPRRPGHDLLIRAKSRRRIQHEAGLLGHGIATRPARGRLRVRWPRANGRPGRTVTLTLRYGTFAIAPPSTHPRRTQLAALPLTVVLAQEEKPPQGLPPVRWLLLSTVPVRCFADAVRLVRWYARRWLIERYNYVLKSGCRLEQLQLETAARLERALATYAVVAWRLLWLTYAARRDPEESCEEVLGRPEWQVLQAQAGQEPTATPPRLREAIGLVARLGGFLGRRGDGVPGVRVIWRGLSRLEDLVTGYRLARQQVTLPNTYG